MKICTVNRVVVFTELKLLLSALTYDLHNRIGLMLCSYSMLQICYDDQFCRLTADNTMQRSKKLLAIEFQSEKYEKIELD